MRLILVIATVAIAGCGTVTDRRDGGMHALRYEYGAVDSPGAMAAAMAERAGQICPNGWKKADEIFLPEGPYRIAYEWRISCL